MGQNNKVNNGSMRSHTARNIVLIVLAALILILGIFAFVFRRYIKAAYVGISRSEEQIHSLQAENDQKHHDAVNKLTTQKFRDLSQEEMSLLASGELSPKDALILIMGGTLAAETTAAFETTVAHTTATAPPEVAEIMVDTEAHTAALTEVPEPIETEVPKPAATEAPKPIVTEVTMPAVTEAPKNNSQTELLQARIDEIIAEIYLLRATYLIEIEEVIAKAKKEYVALPKEQHNLQGKAKFIADVMVPRGNALEKECDAEMDLLLTELESVLVELNMDVGIIDEIRDIYQEQKDLKLAELTDQYT